MERIHVSSSNLVSVGYDAESRVLEIEFTSGAVYQYFDVPPHLYSGLISATSHGQYFSAYIRKGGFAYRQVK